MSIRRCLGVFIASSVLGLGGATASTVPAEAAPPDVWGFAYMHDPAPAANTVMDVTRQWGSWKDTFLDFATVSPLPGLGHYEVRFPHLATSGGVAHVTAVLESDPAWCQLVKWGPSGADELIEVQCYKHGGVKANTTFAIMFSAKSAPPAIPDGAYAYARVNAAGGLVDSYSTSGALNTSSGSGGSYTVVLPKVGDPGGALAGNVQVTAVQPVGARRCKVEGVVPTDADLEVYVLCVNGLSGPAASGFTVSYHRERSVFGEVAPPKRFGYVMTDMAPPPGTDFNSTGSANTTIGSPGQTLVTFKQLGFSETHVQVTASGSTADYCALQAVWQRDGFGDGLVRNVICFDNTGALVPNPAFVTFSSRE